MQAAGRKLKVLFLCTGNACRSQMAEGWARHLHAAWLDAASAGVLASGLDPRAVLVMADAGVDIAAQQSKSIEMLRDPVTGELPQYDVVITVCNHAREACPVFPGNAQHLHVSFDDPPSLARAAMDDIGMLKHYRRVRDEIKQFIETLPGLLLQPEAADGDAPEVEHGR